MVYREWLKSFVAIFCEIVEDKQDINISFSVIFPFLCWEKAYSDTALSIG